jgi:cytosine/creatinine deaminase
MQLGNGSGDGSFELAQIRLHRSSLSEQDVASQSFEFDSDGWVLADLTVGRGIVSSIRSAKLGAANSFGGRVVLPAFIDCHTHLDKGHIWGRKPNPDGSFMGALNAVGEDRSANWNARDVAARMDFALRSAYAHGTKAIRTHLDCVAPQETISWPVFSEMREKWRGKIELQAAALTGVEQLRDTAWFMSLADLVAKHKGVLGTVTYMVPDLDQLLDLIFRLAIERGLDLDFHADETDALDAVSLRHIAEAADRHDFQGKILVGHCCALARQPSDEVKRTLDAVAKRDISIVSLPMCNMYLQDRRSDGTTPRWRGVTLLHEMAARGINVAVASDNTRDPFYAYGDLDMHEVYRMATRTVHFDHPVADWPKTVGANPAKAMRMDDRAGQIAIGAPADFVLFKGRSWTELLSRPESDRIVIRDGKALDAKLPDYSELDDMLLKN